MNEHLPANLYSVKQIRTRDKIAIEEQGIPAYTLMQRAAEFSYQVLKKHWHTAHTIVVVCGMGNNAGDGYVLAKLAHADQKRLIIMSLFDPDTLIGAAKQAYEDFLASGLKVIDFSATHCQEADVIVDAIFGTGLNRDVVGTCSAAISAMNAAAKPMLSLDIPSGLNADTGKAMGTVVQAQVTATFVGLKQGMFTADGLQCTRFVEFNDLGIPATVYENLNPCLVQRLCLTELSSVLKPRPRNSHKGDFGHVLIIGGEYGYWGAARMAAEAATRVGCGLVSVATRSQHAALLSTMRPEVMAHGIETATALKPLLKYVDVIAIGPGLGSSEWAKQMLACVLESALPLILDADALNLLAAEGQPVKNCILTPHPGEAARLLQVETSLIQADRFKSIKMLQEKYQATVVLKGSGTLIMNADEKIYLCDMGNPGMASGGMGDVLTGVIAGLMAQKIEQDQAVKLGVCLHARAGDLAANLGGERGLLALDLMPHLRHLVNPCH